MIVSTHGILASSISSVIYDTDALAFINATGITDNTQKTAINKLVIDLKFYNIWTKMKALYPFVGGTANTHKFNLKDPRDLNAAFRLSFNGGFSHTSLGVVPNGTTSYSDTFFLGGNFTSNINAHISYYSQTSNETNDNAIELGFFQNVSSECVMVIRRRAINQCAGVMFDESTVTSTNNTDAKGMYILSRTANNSLRYYKNNTILQTSSGVTSGGLPTAQKLILFTISNNLNVADNFYSTNKTSSFISIGDGLTDTESANFYTAVQAYQTSLGRNV